MSKQDKPLAVSYLHFLLCCSAFVECTGDGRVLYEFQGGLRDGRDTMGALRINIAVIKVMGVSWLCVDGVTDKCTTRGSLKRTAGWVKVRLRSHYVTKILVFEVEDLELSITKTGQSIAKKSSIPI